MNFKNFDPDECFEEVTEELWQYVYNRDNGICQVSGGEGHETHHIKYRSAGGKNCANNLILLSMKSHWVEHNVEPLNERCYIKQVKKNEKRFRARLV